VVQGTTGWDKRDVTEEAASAFKNAVDLEVGCGKGDGKGVETEACFERVDRDK